MTEVLGLLGQLFSIYDLLTLLLGDTYEVYPSFFDRSFSSVDLCCKLKVFCLQSLAGIEYW